MDPRLLACAEQLHWHLLPVGSRMSPRLASVAVIITRGRRVRRRHSDIRLLFKFVVAIVGGAGGAGVGSVHSLLQVEEELARRHGGGVAEDRATDADRRLFRR